LIQTVIAQWSKAQFVIYWSYDWVWSDPDFQLTQFCLQVKKYQIKTEKEENPCRLMRSIILPLS